MSFSAVSIFALALQLLTSIEDFAARLLKRVYNRTYDIGASSIVFSSLKRLMQSG
ncbi:MAG: hypothetical protein WCI71_18015 [Bacteroidota bacterium]